MKVRTNAETPADARMARSFGAEGIGLCRTEHMFFEGVRIVAMREMILADSEKDRRAALDKLLPMQRSDFTELFEIMAGLPVTIRLLDPPLHEFLPKTRSRDRRGRRGDEGFGRTGCGTGPRRCTSSTRCSAIAAAGSPSPIPRSPRCRRAPSSRRRSPRPGRRAEPVVPEIMVPLVGLKKELDFVKARIDAVAQGGHGRDRRRRRLSRRHDDRAAARRHPRRM